ncbi:hypothetical protein ZOSMA_45G00400 [Zostera marina]|uniref:Uncharacterized protein n=1 Tax=Zostera marina TaxID=29655 RepID=A0A0K9P0J1_ZOSMR|nr:hypothetical protein ZOSMA_45G00400 [Zostera marina]
MDLLSVPSSTSEPRRAAPEILQNMDSISSINLNSDYLITELITLFGHKIAPAVQKSIVFLHSDDASKITRKRKHVQTVGDAIVLDADNMKVLWSRMYSNLLCYL